MGSSFRKYKLRPFLIYQTTVINQKPNMMRLWFFTLLKVRTETAHYIKHRLMKINKSHYIATLLKHKTAWS